MLKDSNKLDAQKPKGLGRVKTLPYGYVCKLPHYGGAFIE